MDEAFECWGIRPELIHFSLVGNLLQSEWDTCKPPTEKLQSEAPSRASENPLNALYPTKPLVQRPEAVPSTTSPTSPKFFPIFAKLGEANLAPPVLSHSRQ